MNSVEAENLTVAYDRKPVLSGVSFAIPGGSLAAVIGPNGAGKTTLLKAMLGLVPVAGGKVRFPEKDGRKPVIGYVPQSESVDWDFPVTALDVVTMGCYGRLGWLKRPKKQDRRLAWETLEKMGMADFADRQISCLSGGQQQRVFLARALTQQADVYFMDEPFKGVDKSTEKVIVEQLKALRDGGRTVVVVHHDLQTVCDYFDWVTVINVTVVANGTVQDVFNRQNLTAAYRCNMDGL